MLQISGVAFGVPKNEGGRLALGQNRGFGHGPSTARIASAACPQVFSLHTLLSKHDNFCAHLDPIGKINDVLVGHPNAAGRHGGPDCIWLVRPMNAIEA